MAAAMSYRKKHMEGKCAQGKLARPRQSLKRKTASTSDRPLKNTTGNWQEGEIYDGEPKI